MSAQGKTRRVRPLLLVLLWIWVIAVAVVVDMFWNVDEFDGIRPRAKLYRGMRIAGHSMVGVPVKEARYPLRRWRGRLLTEAKTPEDVRAMVTFCRQAGYSDVRALKKVALTAKDPLAVGNAIRALGRLRKVAQDAKLVGLLEDERTRVRHETVLALGESGDRSAVGHLKPLLVDKDATTRMLAVRAIGEIGGVEATQLLKRQEARGGATETERAFIRTALSKIRDRDTKY